MPRLGLRLGIGRSSSSRNWTQQKINDNCLFFASDNTSILNKVVATKLPNQVTGSSDYLTVTGVGLNARYRTPNTAPYKTADSDYVFWNTDASESTCDGNRLIAYDFPRILVKYLNVAPYTILWIAILNPGVVVTNGMRDAFDLSVWWSNVLSAHGNVKGNRGNSQALWYPVIYDSLLSHFDGANHDVTSNDEIKGSLTFTGAAEISSTQKKFGTTSLAVLTEGGVSVPNSQDFNFGAGDFTIDLWYYPVNLAASGYGSHLCAQSDTLATASKRQSDLSIGVAAGHIKAFIFYFWDNAGNLLTSSYSTVLLVNNSGWYHIAVVRNGNTIIGYINGVPQCTLDVTGKTLQSSDQKFVIGRLGDYSNNMSFARGYIDEFRVSKGIARWTADFSASLPSSPYNIG